MLASNVPVRSIMDKLPGASSAATGGSVGRHCSLSVALHVEQEETHKEPVLDYIYTQNSWGTMATPKVGDQQL